MKTQKNIDTYARNSTALYTSPMMPIIPITPLGPYSPPLFRPLPPLIRQVPSLPGIITPPLYDPIKRNNEQEYWRRSIGL